jgi:hypothetical protein
MEMSATKMNIKLWLVFNLCLYFYLSLYNYQAAFDNHAAFKNNKITYPSLTSTLISPE